MARVIGPVVLGALYGTACFTSEWWEFEAWCRCRARTGAAAPHLRAVRLGPLHDAGCVHRAGLARDLAATAE